MSTENINKMPQIAQTNVAPQMGGSYNPGRTIGLVLHPALSDFLSAANLTDVKTNAQSGLVHNTYSSRSFMLGPFVPTAENNGEDYATVSRGQLKYQTDPGTWDYIFELEGTYAKAKATRKFLEGKEGNYKGILVDDNYIMRHQRSTGGGVAGFDTHEVRMLPNIEAVSGDICRYRIRVSFRNRKQIDLADFTPITDADKNIVDVFDKLTGLRGVEPVTLRIAATSPNLGTLYVAVEAAEGEENLVDLLQGAGQLKQPSAFILTLEDGTVVTITAVDLVTVNNKVLYFELTLDTLDYDTLDYAWLKLASVSTTFTNTGRYLEAVPIRTQLTK